MPKLSGEKLRGILRKLLIAALTASAVFLLLRTDYFSTAAVRVSASAAAAGGSGTDELVEAAAALRPRAVLARNASGAQSASAWNGHTTEDAYRGFSAFLGEALGSAGVPDEIQEAEFRGGLEEVSVFFDLGAAYPLRLLSAWTGTGGGGAEAHSADLLALFLSEDDVSLCFREGERFFRCATATQPGALRARIEDFQAGPASFAYADPRLREIDPYTVILETLPVISGVSAASARDAADTDRLMDVFGMNSYLATSYYDADGALVLMEGGRTLRLAADGTLTYRGGTERAEGASFVNAVSLASLLAQRSTGTAAGDAEVMFASVTENADLCTVRFDYCIDAIPVRLGAPAAEVVLSGGTVIRATIHLRRYVRTEQSETVLPMFRAAVLAAASGGGTPSLTYAESGEGIQCIWISR